MKSFRIEVFDGGGHLTFLTSAKNHKTAFLAEMYEKLERDERELLLLAEKDPSMKEMAEADLANMKIEKEDKN